MKFLAFLCRFYLYEENINFVMYLFKLYNCLGIPVPVACLLTGTAIADNGDPVPVDETIDFMNFFEVRINQQIIKHEKVPQRKTKR